MVRIKVFGVLVAADALGVDRSTVSDWLGATTTAVWTA